MKNIVGNQEDVVRIDSTGNPTYDTWGTSGGSAGYGVVSNSTYFANNVWNGTLGGAVIGGLVGNSMLAAPQVYSNHGGTPQAQGSPSPMFVLVATQDCHKYAPASKLYARYPIYSLRLGTNMIQEPQCQNGNQQCYTVFESISPDPTVCPSGSKLNPCQYADGTGKSQYNEFADEISAGFGTSGGFNNRTQRFKYGLPGKRLYDVDEIYRTLPDKSLQLKTPNTDFNKLQATPQEDPLIDGNLDPWLAPWNGLEDSCNSFGSQYFGQN